MFAHPQEASNPENNVRYLTGSIDDNFFGFTDLFFSVVVDIETNDL